MSVLTEHYPPAVAAIANKVKIAGVKPDNDITIPVMLLAQVVDAWVSERMEHNAETYEFNAGFEAGMEGAPITAEPNSTRFDVWRYGWVAGAYEAFGSAPAVDDLADSAAEPLRMADVDAGDLAKRYDDAVAAELEEERRGTWAAPLWPKKKDA